MIATDTRELPRHNATGHEPALLARWLSIRSVWVVLTIAAAFIGPASTPIGLPDVLWTLVRGQWMADHGRLIDVDPFTSAPHVDGPVVNVQWLADLFFHGLEAAGGLSLVIAGTAVVVAITFGLLLAAAVTASGHLRLSCVAIWLVYILAASNLSPRPQTLSYPLFALALFAVAKAEFRRDTRWLWLLPPAMTLWANLHGSFFTGFVLLGCAALGAAVSARDPMAARPYVVSLGACLLASLLNPYGVGALVYVVSIGSNPVIRDYVTEWAPTTVAWREGILFSGSLLVLGAVMLKARLRLSATELLLLLVFGYLAWSSVRAIVWWGLILAPILARLLGSLWPRLRLVGRDLPIVNSVVLAGIVGLAVLSLPWTKSAVPILPADKQGVFSADSPVRVGDYLRSHDPPSKGTLLNHQGWGGYLEWAAWPRHTPFLDGRIELHPTQVWLDYLEIVFPSAHWRALLDKYGVGYVVLSQAEEADLIGDLRAEPGWLVDYEDDQAVVLSRDVAPSAGN